MTDDPDRSAWAMPRRDQCGTCSAPIRWVRTAAKGRPMPIDDVPVHGGNVELTPAGAVVHGQPELAPDGPRYVAHFATCPNWER